MRVDELIECLLRPDCAEDESDLRKRKVHFFTQYGEKKRNVLSVYWDEKSDTVCVDIE